MPSAATERFYPGQVGCCWPSARRGRRALDDLDCLPGGHQRLLLARRTTPPSPGRAPTSDRCRALIGAVFGKGGGDEIARAPTCSPTSRPDWVASPGARRRDDLRAAQDPEAPTSTSAGRFRLRPHLDGATSGRDTGSTPVRSTRPVCAPRRTAQSSIRPMSNFLHRRRQPLAPPATRWWWRARRSVTSTPVPDGARPARRGDRRARGASPAVSACTRWSAVGRTTRTATSSRSDVIDQFAETLCNPDGSGPTLVSLPVQGPLPRDEQRRRRAAEGVGATPDQEVTSTTRPSTGP